MPNQDAVDQTFISHIFDQVNKMNSLDPKHEALVPHKLIQLVRNHTLEPYCVEDSFAESDDRLGGLLADHENGVDDHAQQSWFNFLTERLLFNVAAQLGEELHGSQADAPNFILSEISQRWNQFFVDRPGSEDADERLQVLNQTNDDLRAVVLQEDADHGNQVRASFIL